MGGNVAFALGLTIFAGLSTGVGSIMAFFSKSFNPKFLAGTLGFSAGVMVYVSLVEIFVKARDSLSLAYGPKIGYWYTVIAFFSGIAVIALIDKLIPSYENPHEIKNLEKDFSAEGEEKRKLLRMGLFSALAIGIHNFPEGLATFMGALQDPTMGISIAVAIAIHNIPRRNRRFRPPLLCLKKSEKSLPPILSLRFLPNRWGPCWVIFS